MPIITKPASIEKNSPAEISLDKSALAAVASVAASAYYSDSANWKEVFIYYKSSIGNQREVLKFDATIASPTTNFLVSDKARDIFQVQKIVIMDFDNGSITVPRSQLTVADFDVDMTPAPAAGIAFQLYSEYEVATPTVNPTYLENQTDNVYAPFARALSNVSIGAITSGVANFDITFNLSDFSANDTGSGAGVQVGLYCTNIAPGSIDISVLNSQPYDGDNTIQALLYGNYAGTWRKAGIYGISGFGPLGSETAWDDPATTIRIKQTGNTIEFYRNGNLYNTADSSSSTVSCLYMYPFVWGTGKHTVDSVTVENTIPSVTWDFASRPAYSLNAQGEIVGSSTGLSYDTSTILFSLSEYTIPANGLELKMVANNGWAIEDAHFFGVCDPFETVFNGFYYAANIAVPSFGVNNILQTPYVYPATPEVEFKIIIKTTQTEFYVNGILQSTLAPVSNGSPTIKVATRFDNDINIKSCTIVEL